MINVAEARIERRFTYDRPPGTQHELMITIRPGRVNVPAAGDLSFHDTRRLGVHLEEAGRASQALMDLRDQLHDSARDCTTCGKQIEEGHAFSEDEVRPGRVRHIIGSVVCGR